MRDLKNIDRLFQEKFKDFEAEPSEQVWKNIEAALKEKDDDRKIIPFWWKLAGIAAALLIGFAAWNLSSEKSQTENGVVLEQPKTNPLDGNTTQNAVATGKDADKGNPSKSLESPIINPAEAATKDINQKTNGPSKPALEKAVAEGSKSKKAKSGSKTLKNSSFETDANQSVAAKTESRTKTAKRKMALTPSRAGQTENAVAHHRSKASRKQLKSDQAKAALSGANGLENEAVAANGSRSGKNQPKHPQNAVGNNPGESPSQKENSPALENNANPGLSPFTPSVDKTVAVKETPVANPKLDSAAVAPVVPNPLEELLQQKNEKETKIAETKLNRWQITTNVAPVYFSSTSNGSPIDKEFEGNSKSYENNLAYGVGVNYALSKKWNVRAGVNKLTLAYNTNDVVFFAGFRPQAFDNIDVSSNATQLEVMNKGGETTNLLPFESNIQNTNSGAINQKMGYVEVPLELSYKLLDRKFGISFIGGVSTLFLSENEVRVVSSSMSTTLGKANNLNDVHFSTNLGLGFQYNFWRAFQFHFEPTFKYQVNTFSNDSGNFKPYFIGLYSGLSFKF